MNIEKRFIAIQSFLNKHSYLHELEALERYPFSSSKYLEWVQNLSELSFTEKLDLENNLDSKLIVDTDYKDFLETIKELQNIPIFSKSNEKINPKLLSRINNKKRHEIEIIKAQLKETSFDHFIDIGSGAGHLSSVLIDENKKTSECYDENQNFQKIGKDKLKKFAPEILKRLSFTPAFIDENTKLKTKKNSLLIGLHSCGDLSPIILEHFIKSDIKGVLNYGCCYHKLTSKYLNLSSIAKVAPVNFNKYNLTLATKSYKVLSEKDAQIRKQVKRFRYSLHLYLKEKFQDDFTTLGNASNDDYHGEFSEYAKKYVHKLSDTPASELEEFYAAPKTIKIIESILNFGILRSHMARLIELYIVLDRLLWLRENGRELNLIESFDRSLSPRNLCLYCF